MKWKKEIDEIKIPFDFNYTELTAIEEYLTQQEEKGWRLKEIESKSFVFQKAEPRKILYSVEIFKAKDASFIEPYPEFVESCEAEGWELAGFYHDDLYVFRTEKEDAIDIMTDEKEKFKAVAKRVLLQPGYLGFTFWVIYRMIDIFVLKSDYEPLFETNIYVWLSIIIAVYYIAYMMLKFLDFFEWLFKSKKCILKGEKIPFSNLKEHRQKNIANNIAVVFLEMICSALIVYLGIGYEEEDWIFLLCGVFVLFGAVNLVYNYSKRKNGEETSKVAHIIAVTVAVVVIAGTFITVQYNRKMYEENTGYITNNNSVPVSLSDFGIEANDCEDSTEYVYATRLAQQYNFCSKKEKESYQEDTQWLDYQVFVSESPKIRQRYINRILHNYEKRGTSIMKIEGSEWDEYYREFNSGEMTNLGFAVKDNMVVFLDWCWMDENEDFFEVAYEKLFTKTE